MLTNWRLILDPAYSGVRNMAIDAALLKSANTSKKPLTTLRLYSWSVPTISVGYQQKPENFSQYNLPVVRRLTGGRAVLHDKELTYSITVPKFDQLFAGGITDAYAAISRCLVAALKDVGVQGVDFARPASKLSITEREKRFGSRQKNEACFLSSSRYEVVVGGKKMVGSAQRRFSGAFLQHGSILANVDEAMIEKVFGKELIDKITWLGAHTSCADKELKEALVRGFEKEMDVALIEAPLTELEKESIEADVKRGEESNRGKGESLIAL